MSRSSKTKQPVTPQVEAIPGMSPLGLPNQQYLAALAASKWPQIERVSGDKVTVGDVLWVEGHRFVVTAAPELGTGNIPITVRYTIALEALGGELRGTPYQTMHAGLRLDLCWSREVGTRMAECAACHTWQKLQPDGSLTRHYPGNDIENGTAGDCLEYLKQEAAMEAEEPEPLRYCLTIYSNDRKELQNWANLISANDPKGLVELDEVEELKAEDL